MPEAQQRLRLDLRLPQPKHSQSQSRNQREDGQDDGAQRQAAKREHERRAKAAESNCRVEDCPRRVIPYKEYAAHKAAEKKTSTATKLTLKSNEEENWDDEPLCPPRSTPLGARSVLPPKKEE